MRGYLRSRVELNALNPLPLGIWLLRPDQTESWVEFLYERLANFCFHCGRLGHGLDHCKFESVVDDKDGMRHYGSWMQAKISRDLDVSPPIQLPVETRRRAVATRRTVGDPIASGVHAPPERVNTLERVNRCDQGVPHIANPVIIPALQLSDVGRGNSADTLSFVPNGEGPVARIGSSMGASGSRPIFLADASVRQWFNQELFISETNNSVFVGPKCWNLPLGPMAGIKTHTLGNSEVCKSGPGYFINTPKIQTARMSGEIQPSEPPPIHHTPVVSEPVSPPPIFPSKRSLTICSSPKEPVGKKPKIATQPFHLAVSTRGANTSPKISRGRRVREGFLQLIVMIYLWIILELS
ncbi:uncharacterized protein Pyn_23264 [Prunus yedoensis var. nudiflora]|uniref:Zinc knuckle CX2CX4HX4C domain-containing protein n=1 Tax=Prunus yedoensis var. nudiflora TaxID=2094558 RepID=A0A314YGB8_PRUYE|nr:uncharacterized protein Pyn_23264 [Prunus yedoensis var. nudiflora]